MFHRLDGRTATIWNRMLQHGGVLVFAGVIFGSLYFGILVLE